MFNTQSIIVRKSAEEVEQLIQNKIDAELCLSKPEINRIRDNLYRFCGWNGDPCPVG